MNNALNNREIATLIWLTVFLILALQKRGIRDSLINAIKTLFQKKVILLLVSTFLYFLVVIIAIYHINFWNYSLTKDSIEWFLLSGIAAIFTALTSGKEEHFFKKILKDNVSAILIVEFISNAYTLPLIAELFLVPFIVSIALVLEISKTNSKYKQVERFMNNIQIILGLSILFLSIYGAALDWKNFWSLQTLKNFLLPPILTISFIPFIYFAELCSQYEQIFWRLNVGENKSKELKNYAKRRIFNHVFLNLKRANKILYGGHIIDLTNIKSKEDVNKLIEICKKLN